MDVAINRGGCFETSRATTHSVPTYGADGTVHHCVANMPGAVPLTSSYALSHATLAPGLALAAKGARTLLENVNLQADPNIHRGQGDPSLGCPEPEHGVPRSRGGADPGGAVLSFGKLIGWIAEPVTAKPVLPNFRVRRTSFRLRKCTKSIGSRPRGGYAVSRTFPP